ncbi:MAG: Trm112 family protein [Candidatus Dormibacteraeota bacterium]|nr:Trm112 family protein [Candidatus Dormibacteraeota bacterium]
MREVLACPRCYGPLTDVQSQLNCASCRVMYPIEDGIPVLVIDAATQIDATEG